MPFEGQTVEERSGKVAATEEETKGVAQEAPKGAAQTDEGGDPEDWEAAFKRVKDELETAKRGGEEASRRAAVAEDANRRLRGEVHQGQVSVRRQQIAMLDRAIQAEAATIEAAKRDYAAALEAGEYAKAADAQEVMAEAASRRTTMLNGKAQLEATPEPQAPAPQQGEPTTFEEKLARYTPRTQAFIRRHPELLNDDRMRERAEGLHSIAKSKGYVPDSDAYFDYLERNLTDESAASGQPGSRKTGAAPPSRNPLTTGRRNTSGMTVADMTPRMLELAHEADMKPEAWLAEYTKLVDSGEIEPLN